MPNSLSKKLIFLGLFLPFLLWVMIFNESLFGQKALFHDTYANYCMFKYFYNNLFNGVIPLWEPFLFFGRPEFYIGPSGVLNPLALIVFSLHFLGLDYLILYRLYLAVYFLVGVLGFFFLCRHLLKNDAFALVGAWCLIFSGLGGTLFFQVNEILIFVPAVWFFVFLLRFFSYWKLKDFLGLIFSLMISLCSYFPFYLAGLFLAFIFIYFLIFTKSFILQLKSFILYMLRHKLLIFCSSVLLLIASMPLLLFGHLNSTGEIVSLHRHHMSVKDFKDDKSLSAQMTYNEVADWDSLADIYGGGDWFAVFSFFNSDDFSYIPLICIIIILISLGTTLDRTHIVIFVTGFLIFLIGMGSATPFYHFLFDHIFFFKYFRNLYFFTIYLLAITILLAVIQLKNIIDQYSIYKSKLIPIVWVFIGHLTLYFLLRYFGCVFNVMYLVVFLSLAFFTGLVLGMFKGRWYLILAVLFCLIVLESRILFIEYQRSFPVYKKFQLPKLHDTVQFNFLRPIQDDLNQAYGSSLYYMLPILASFKDTSGAVVYQPDAIQRNVVKFYQKFPLDEQKRYFQHKIVIYDHDPNMLKEKNLPQFIENNSNEFRILHFDSNSLTFQSNFSSAKFLVYNDSYSRYWKVYINDKKGEIQETNFAFKGISLNAGKNLVRMIFCPIGGQWIYILVIISNFLFFGYLLYLNLI